MWPRPYSDEESASATWVGAFALACVAGWSCAGVASVASLWSPLAPYKGVLWLVLYVVVVLWLGRRQVWSRTGASAIVASVLLIGILMGRNGWVPSGYAEAARNNLWTFSDNIFASALVWSPIGLYLARFDFRLPRLFPVVAVVAAAISATHWHDGGETYWGRLLQE